MSPSLKIWMFENKFESLPSHLKTIEPMEVHRGAGTMCNTETSKMISRTDPVIPRYQMPGDAAWAAAMLEKIRMFNKIH